MSIPTRPSLRYQGQEGYFWGGVEPSFRISAAHNGETVHFLSRCYAVRGVTKIDHSMEVGIEFHASRREVHSVGARSLDMSRLLALVAHALAGGLRGTVARQMTNFATCISLSALGALPSNAIHLQL